MLFNSPYFPFFPRFFVWERERLLFSVCEEFSQTFTDISDHWQLPLNTHLILFVSMCGRPREIAFTLPPRFITQNHGDRKNNEQDKKEEEDPQRDVLAHRGSLSVRSRSLLLFIWQRIKTVRATLLVLVLCLWKHKRIIRAFTYDHLKKILLLLRRFSLDRCGALGGTSSPTLLQTNRASPGPDNYQSIT